MKLFYFIILITISLIFVVVYSSVNRNKKLYIPLIIMILSLLIMFFITYKDRKKVWDSKYDNSTPLADICSSNTLSGYAALVNISDRCSNPCLHALGICYLIKLYHDKYGIEKTKQYLEKNIKSFTMSDLSYPWITEWISERNTFVEYNYGEPVWNLLDSQEIADRYAPVFNRACKDGFNKGVCDFFFTDNMTWNSGQQDVYVSDYKWYDLQSSEIVIKRCITLKLDDKHVITFSHVTEAVRAPPDKLNNMKSSTISGSSGEIANKSITKLDPNRKCVLLSNSDFYEDPGTCEENSVTESDAFDYDRLFFNMDFCGENCFICLGQMYVLEQIVKTEGLCKAISIINSNIDKFGSHENDYYPFIDMYDKLDENIISKVNSRTEFIGMDVRDIDRSIISEVVEKQPIEERDILEKHLVSIIEKHPLRLFLDAFNGKQLVEYISINSDTKEPIIKRSLVKLFTTSDEPYNIYMIGVGYTLSILKPTNYLD